MKVYTASSWRNPRYDSVVLGLRRAGFEIYDFRNPDNGAAFQWADIDPAWRSWTPEKFREALEHPLAEAGFASDSAGMGWADACVLVLPSGRSSHVEAGMMKGAGKPVFVLHGEGCGEPELTYKAFDGVCLTVPEVVAALNGVPQRRPART